MKKGIGLIFFVVLFAAISSAMAATIPITPASGTLVGPPPTRWEGNQTSNAEILTAITAIMGPGISELYKQNAGEATDSDGPGGITTSFNGDLSGGTITFPAAWTPGSPLYLLVKDGAQTPAWYLFNLTALDWHPGDTIELSGFWPGNGAISHVAIYGVPEPATLLLLGAGLIGLGLFARKR